MVFTYLCYIQSQSIINVLAPFLSQEDEIKVKTHTSLFQDSRKGLYSELHFKFLTIKYSTLKITSVKLTESFYTAYMASHFSEI